MLTVLEDRRSKIKMLADSVSGERLLSCAQLALFCCALTWWSEQENLCEVSLVRALTPIMETPPSWPTHFPKAPPPNIITLGNAFFYIWIWGGHKHSDNSANNNIKQLYGTRAWIEETKKNVVQNILFEFKTGEFSKLGLEVCNFYGETSRLVACNIKLWKV